MSPRKLKSIIKRNGLNYAISIFFVLLIYNYSPHVYAVFFGCIGLIWFEWEEKNVQKKYLNYKKKIGIKDSIDLHIIPAVNYLLDKSILCVFIDYACSVLKRNCINANSNAQELINHSCTNIMLLLEKIKRILKHENFSVKLNEIKKSIEKLETIHAENQQIVDTANCAFDFDKNFAFEIIEEVRQLHENDYDSFSSHMEGVISRYYDTGCLVSTLNKSKYEYLDKDNYIVTRIDFAIIALSTCNYISDIARIIQDLKNDLLTKCNEDIEYAENELGNLLNKV